MDTQDQKTIFNCKDKMMVAGGVARERTVKAACVIKTEKLPYWKFDEYEPLPLCPNGATYCDNSPTIECVEFSCQSLEIDSSTIETGMWYVHYKIIFKTHNVLYFKIMMIPQGMVAQQYMLPAKILEKILILDSMIIIWC